MKMLQSPVVAAIIGGILFLVTSTVLTTKGIPPMVHASEPAEHKPEPEVNGPSWNFFNPEMDQIIEELKTERSTIAAREKQLAELAARLKAEKAELEDEVKKIRAMQAKVDRDVTSIKEDEAENLKKLSKMYASMEPGGAARILRELDDAVVVKILKLMKEAEKGLVLDAFARIGTDETKRAAMLSEALRATSAKAISAK